MSRRTLARVAAALLGAVLAACFSVEKDYPEIRTYVLDVERGGEPAPGLEGAVLVRRLSISPRYAGKAFVRTADSVTFESDYYNQFFVPPRDLVTEALEEWVAASGLFEHVVGSGSRVEPEFLFEGNVAALYGATGGGAATGVLELQVALLREGDGPARIEFERAYREEVPAADASARALVRAWSEALTRALTALEADLRGALPAGG